MENENRFIMQRSLTQGPITRNMLLFALPLMCGNLLQQMYTSLGTRVALAYLLSATPLGVTGIWLSVPIGWALADAIGIGYYFKNKKTKAAA